MSEINLKLVYKILAILAVIALMYFFNGLLLFIFVGILGATALMPAVDFIEKKTGFNRAFISAITVFMVLLTLLLTIFLTFASVTNSFELLWENLPSAIDNAINLVETRIGNDFTVNWDFITWQSQNFTAENIFNQVIGITSLIFGFAASSLAFLFLLFYLILMWEDVTTYVVSFFPRKEKYLSHLIVTLQHKLGSWLRGQLLNMIIVGTVTFTGLYFLGVPSALALGILAGLFELIPYVGPTLAAIPAVLIAFLIAPEVAIWVVLLYVIIQQIESYVLVPFVMKEVAHLNPIVTLIAIIFWAQLLGVSGAILAIPLTCVIAVLVEEYRTYTRNKHKTQLPKKGLKKQVVEV